MLALFVAATCDLRVQVNCSIAGSIVIRVLQYRAALGGYLQLTFLNIIGGIDSVLVSQSQANVSSYSPWQSQPCLRCDAGMLCVTEDTQISVVWAHIKACVLTVGSA